MRGEPDEQERGRDIAYEDFDQDLQALLHKLFLSSPSFPKNLITKLAFDPAPDHIDLIRLLSTTDPRETIKFNTFNERFYIQTSKSITDQTQNLKIKSYGVFVYVARRAETFFFR